MACCSVDTVPPYINYSIVSVAKVWMYGKGEHTSFKAECFKIIGPSVCFSISQLFCMKYDITMKNFVLISYLRIHLITFESGFVNDFGEKFTFYSKHSL